MFAQLKDLTQIRRILSTLVTSWAINTFSDKFLPQVTQFLSMVRCRLKQWKWLLPHEKKLLSIGPPSFWSFSRHILPFGFPVQYFPKSCFCEFPCNNACALFLISMSSVANVSAQEVQVCLCITILPPLTNQFHGKCDF